MLKDECIHPTSNLPYVRSFKAGKDNSKENLQVYPNHSLIYYPSPAHYMSVSQIFSSNNFANNPGVKQKGYSHLFIMEFDNTDDRDYYVGEDPVHQEYVKKLTTGEFPVEEVQVLDFAEGVY